MAARPQKEKVLSNATFFNPIFPKPLIHNTNPTRPHCHFYMSDSTPGLASPELHRRLTYRLDAELHGLHVELDGLVSVGLLVLLEGLGDQEVGSLQVHLLPGLQRVATLCLDCGQRVGIGLRI